MFVRLQRSIQLLCVAAFGWSLAGCQTPRLPTGFETEEEIEEYVEKTQMLHRRARVDVKGGASIPFDSDMEIGPGGGIKASLEGFKNLYFGIEYDFYTSDIDETIADFQDDFAVNPAQAESDALSADGEQWLDSFDRHNVLFTFDYEIPLGDAWGIYTPIIRAGVGIGAVFIVGDEVAAGTFADEVDARLYANFLARPQVMINFPVHENVQIFLEAAADLMPSKELTIDGNLVGRRTRVEDDVNFSAVSLHGGISFTW